jgi:hypothetical protein
VAEPPRNGTGLSSSTIIPWLAVAMSVGSAFLTVANPRDDVKQARQETREDLRAIEARMMAEITGVKTHLGERLLVEEHREFSKRISESVATTRDDLTRLRADFVPRAEHQQHWTEQSDRIAGIRDGLNDLRKDFVAISPPADRIKGLEAQIVAMQTRLDTLVRMQGQAAAQPPAAGR